MCSSRLSCQPLNGPGNYTSRKPNRNTFSTDCGTFRRCPALLTEPLYEFHQSTVAVILTCLQFKIRITPETGVADQFYRTVQFLDVVSFPNRRQVIAIWKFFKNLNRKCGKIKCAAIDKASLTFDFQFAVRFYFFYR